MTQQHTLGKKATTIHTDEKGYICVIYHRTIVVKFNDKKIILNSGGWRTNTTKTRINQASNQFDLGYSVIQKDFDWYINFKDKIKPFEDNIILNR